ncbi:response regulator transcription factor [bacterium]|nr:response regulator transcription factor [bacterium]
MIYLGEHDPKWRDSLRQRLAAWELRSFEDAQTLFHALQEGEPPGLLLLDLLLPGMDPFLMVRLLKFDARFAQMPVLCLTPYQEPGLPDRLHRLGARGWLAPGDDPALFLEAVGALLSRFLVPTVGGSHTLSSF